ncbi:MAG: CBM96 family carbohydrate-binding protein [Promethearchaeota archaeon]
MKKREFFFTILACGLFGLFILPTVAATTITTYADKNATVYETNPDQKWSDGILWISIDYADVYIHFNFTNRPNSWDKVCVVLSLGLLTFGSPPPGVTGNVELYLVKGTWDEQSITYSNRPIPGNLMASQTVPSNGNYTLDITDYVSKADSDLSVCVKTSGDLDIGITSREYGGGPRLVWTTATSDVPGYPVLMVLTSGLAALVLVSFRYMKGKNASQD